MSILIKYSTFFFILITGSIFSQNHFNRIYTDKGFDYGEGITQASDSTYYITGSSSSFMDAPSQAFILHVDTAGNYLWSQSYGGNESDIGKRIFKINNDGMYIFGHSNSFSNGYFDFYVFKTDSLGSLLWQKNIGGVSNEMLYDVAILPDTSFILVGQTTSNTTEIEDVFICRLDKKGEIKWQKTFGSQGVDIGRAVKVIDTTQIIISGEYFDSDSSLTKGLLISIHQNGNLNWLNYYGIKGNYVFNDISVDSSIIRAVGYSRLKNTTQKRYATFKCTPLGTNMIEAIYIQSGDNYFSHIVQHGPYKNQYLTLQPTDNNVIPTYSDGEDLLICRYKYDLTWATKCVNPSNHGIDHCNQIIATNDLGAISVGYNTFKGKGGANVTLLKIGPYDQFPDTQTDPIESTLVKIHEINSNDLIHISPNPSSGLFNVVGENLENATIEVQNYEGRLIYNEKRNINNTINLENNPNGIYFVHIINNNSSKIIKITLSK